MAGKIVDFSEQLQRLKLRQDSLFPRNDEQRLTRHQAQFLDTVHEVYGVEPGEAQSIGFLTWWVCAAALPHKNIADSGTPAALTRRNGAFRLTIQWLPPGPPYGRYPRLLLVYLSTEAVRRKSREIYLGDSVGELMTSLGLYPSRGHRGTVHRFTDQVWRLINATFSVEHTSTDEFGGRTDVMGFRVTSRATKWWSREHVGDVDWEAHFTLSNEFYEGLVERPVPLDLRIVRALRSPLALDIYFWLTHRAGYNSRITRITWEQLQDQFGSGHARQRDFRRDFEAALGQVLALFPAAVESTSAGLELRPCSPSVRRSLVP